MADYEGINKTLYDAGTRISEPHDGAKVHVTADEYECSSVAATKTINVGTPIPKGHQIVGIQVFHDALGTGVTLDVGNSDDDDEYHAAADVSSAGQFWCNLIASICEPLTAEEQVMLTIGGAAATGTIKVQIFHSSFQ